MTETARREITQYAKEEIMKTGKFSISGLGTFYVKEAKGGYFDFKNNQYIKNPKKINIGFTKSAGLKKWAIENDEELSKHLHDES